MQIKSRSIGPKEASQSKQNSTRSQNQGNGKESFRKQSECNYCGASPSHPKLKKCRTFLLECKCRKCGKEGHVAQKCLSKPQNVNAVDDSDSIADKYRFSRLVFISAWWCNIHRLSRELLR